MMDSPRHNLDKPASDLLQSEHLRGLVEGYALALDAVMNCYAGESSADKWLDPLSVDVKSQTLFSYAFNMKGEGRLHPIANYQTVREICDFMRADTIEWIG